ncbi:semaphorin-4D isoform X1 [Hemicordylus capensis]|uniref:semaphorin-4D isoform X1 n=1 Tax=Hemicordylus capensis TaxID=884348 RepID=UPI002304A791|nr:semaphorin-4D isoform X1 [Hemicordylus capensis]XP_053151094.1 semaphorin-4D isoform X1 [Hemicordylus capensis]XP_053151095.1 semaphorin-4D isoform X1 [Hemicordylus capensis]XP_053151096.1 semaphorin-4D isoform X1 [Hemicordylus capensis]XP_053151097.1 semaphorin-4D isoform X1 [Hemicordylus capensis]XP_053151098.1 semaphorin-4D isoform X1 [Hemicordylus capensis]
MSLLLYGAVSLFLGIVAALGPVPRITWEHKEVHLVHFQESETFNYSTLLLSEDKDILYVGAREVIFALNSLNISEKRQEVFWKVTEDKKTKCAEKGKSKQTECLNYVRVLQQLNDTFLYVCGTNAFQPVCDHLNLKSFELGGRNEDGKGRCPFDPAQSYTSVMVDGELYSGTSYNFLGSEPIISRNSQQSPLRTEYAIPWLNEPNFIFADVIRTESESEDGDDDKVYFFFTEVSVEYEFLGKLMIPRIARVCKGDRGGLRTLQKKWTSYLKARLLCSVPDKNLFFNIVNDIFILKSPNSKEPVIYGVFTPQLNNVGLSAVCAYNISTVEDVFAKGKYMQSATVEQSHTKWVRYNGDIPKPRPGACINKEAKADNYETTLNLPDKTLQFVKDHPLMDDSVTPIGDKPRLVKRDVKYTQIVVDQVQALNGTTYDVMFISTDRGALHKAISYENGMHIIEETQLFPNFESIQTLLLSFKKGKQYLYAGSNAGVVQSPLAFCDKYSTCVDCVLARDPYCAWSPHESVCVDIFKESETGRDWIQNIGGDASSCTHDTLREHSLQHTFKHGSTAELKCSQKSNLAQVVWKFKDDVLKVESPKYRLLEKALLIFNLSEGDSGVYQCLSEEKVKNQKFSQVLAKHVLELKKTPHTTLSPTQPTIRTEGNGEAPKMSTVPILRSSAHTSTTPVVPFTTSRIGTNPTVPFRAITASNVEHLNSPPEVPEKAMFLKSNDNFLLMFLFLFFFVLFLCLFSYNCYKGYLPDQCLKFRSALLLGKKKPKADFSDCEQSVKETLVEPGSLLTQSGDHPKPAHDTGYETEADYGNGHVQHSEDHSQSYKDIKDKPFDVKCELKFADSDAEGD